MEDVLSVALRTLSFLFLLRAGGVALFIAVFGRYLSSSQSAIRRVGELSGLLGIACVAGHFVLEAARMAGELAGVMDASLQKTVLKSANGAAFALRVLGLAIVPQARVTPRARLPRALALIIWARREGTGSPRLSKDLY